MNIKKILIKCVKCKKEYYVGIKYYRKLNILTHNCKQCKLYGEGNPNYGKKWSTEMKIKQSETIKLKVDEAYRLNCSKGMKGKKVSIETKNKKNKTMLEKYGKFNLFTGHTKESLLIIGKKSREKFTKEFKNKIRKIHEQNGNWLSLKEKDDYYFYRDQSNWIGQVLTEDTINIDKLKTNPLYDINNRNKNSLIRDHIYGRKMGFKEKVFPEILRHPANCQLISHSENIKKSKKQNDCDFNLDDLFKRIIEWKIFYSEQKICLKLINDYKNGLRYKKEDYIKKMYE